MINYLKVQKLFKTLLTLPEMSVYRDVYSVNETIHDFMQDYKLAQRSGSTGSIDVYVDGNQVSSIPKLLLDNLCLSTREEKYWQHEGLKREGRFILPLWCYSTRAISAGSWEFLNNLGVKVAEVNQTVDYSDPIIAEMLFMFPDTWIKKIDFTNDLTASIIEVSAYVIFFTTDEGEIENVLLALASVGLHAFEKLGKWCHSLEVGCENIQATPGVIETSPSLRFSLERSKMFRFASSAYDPFDALIRYWHIIEHMFDDLIFENVNDLLATSPRPMKFGRKIQDIAKEGDCAKEIFIRYFDDTSFHLLVNFVNRNGLQAEIMNAITILGNQTTPLAFWGKTPNNGKEALGCLLYLFRNAVAHRRESESWFNRLDEMHYQSVKRIIPLFHYSVHLLLQDA
ncbi:hypothetical protein [Paenibacillus mesotrionivorans]|uniref:Uncharacterized protein n=1 Tax=Paenibacillus mesotrionivorans TaxID=3160968 RepID=A0ACC7NXV9_9BACL